MTESAEATVPAKDRPFLARIVENRLLTRPGSGKETRHLVVDLAGSGLSYRPGDSLGVYPTNRPEDVAGVLRAIGAGGGEPVVLPKAGAAVPLREALAARLALNKPGRRVLETLAARAAEPAERARLASLLAPESSSSLAAFLAEREFADLLAEFPSARLGPQELVDHLRRLVPRLYSIASAPEAHPTEAHLTVAVVRYRTNGRERVGVCSTYLADRAPLGRAEVPVFVASSSFRPPEDPARDVIMVGPGTGVAPFRAFLQHRTAIGAPGRHWLFFGEQRRATDFLYEEDWSGWLAAGRLHRLDTAFSRDQPAKIYVQDRMRERAPELWSWIAGGAAFYVCGDARRMARDVDAALHEIAARAGGLGAEGAANYVRQMKKEKRYLRDVY
jgi:sulfite reductase (NADPH) flavoprotein alpha-component